MADPNKLHVLFAVEGKHPPYLIGEEGSGLVRVFNPFTGSLGPPVLVGSVQAHMPGKEFWEYEEDEGEEAEILAKVRKAMADRGEGA